MVWLVTSLDQTQIGMTFPGSFVEPRLRVVDAIVYEWFLYAVICARMFICMNMCMNECRSTWIYECMNVWFRRLYITSEADKTGQVRWESDWHRSTNTRQSSLWDESNHLGEEAQWSKYRRGKAHLSKTWQKSSSLKPHARDAINQTIGRRHYKSTHRQKLP